MGLAFGLGSEDPPASPVVLPPAEEPPTPSTFSVELPPAATFGEESEMQEDDPDPTVQSGVEPYSRGISNVS